MDKPVPLDQELYDKIKQDIYSKYPKHSIYRSMMIVREYLRQGGEYATAKTKKSSTKTWLDEQWTSANDYYHTGKFIQCGNSDTMKKYGEYPLCYARERLLEFTRDELGKLIKEKTMLGKRHLGTKEMTGKGQKEYPIHDIVNLPNVRKMARAEGYDPKRILPPTKKNSKLSYLTPDGRRINFGHASYESYDRHKDELRRERYLKRATNMKGNWRDDKYSANNLSIHLLWSPSVIL